MDDVEVVLHSARSGPEPMRESWLALGVASASFDVAAGRHGDLPSFSGDGPREIATLCFGSEPGPTELAIAASLRPSPRLAAALRDVGVSGAEVVALLAAKREGRSSSESARPPSMMRVASSLALALSTTATLVAVALAAIFAGTSPSVVAICLVPLVLVSYPGAPAGTSLALLIPFALVYPAVVVVCKAIAMVIGLLGIHCMRLDEMSVSGACLTMREQRIHLHRSSDSERLRKVAGLSRRRRASKVLSG